MVNLKSLVKKTLVPLNICRVEQLLACFSVYCCNKKNGALFTKLIVYVGFEITESGQ